MRTLLGQFQPYDEMAIISEPWENKMQFLFLAYLAEKFLFAYSPKALNEQDLPLAR